MAECTCADIMADDQTRHFRGCPLREKYPTHVAEASSGRTTKRVPVEVFADLERERNTYRDTCKNAQEAGTRLWNQLVHARNLLRIAQPYLETHLARCDNSDDYADEDDPDSELDALCAVIANEVGTLEDNTSEEDGRRVAERLGIDIEKWAEELRAKVDAADAKEKEER